MSSLFKRLFGDVQAAVSEGESELDKLSPLQRVAAAVALIVGALIVLAVAYTMIKAFIAPLIVAALAFVAVRMYFKK